MAAMRDVVFLGAGASASDGAPVQSRLFREYFKLHGGSTENGELAEFFSDFFGIDIASKKSEIEFPSFEEILGILELAILRGESFRGYPLITHDPKVQLVREHLIFLIARILKDKLESSHLNHHRSLIGRLLADRKSLLSTTFISLNYDILIDNALTDVHRAVDLDYGVEFTNFLRRNDWHRPRRGRSVELLKLHGSLNWLYCPTCTSLTLTPKEKGAVVTTIAHRLAKCKKCNSLMTPIIIPPTFLKVMSNHHLQRIWKTAEARLLACDRIIFCGYSFPDADLHIRYLLKRIEVNRGHTPLIHVLNHHPGKDPAMAKDEEVRYKRFFKDDSRVNYTEFSFQDFCKRDFRVPPTPPES